MSVDVLVYADGDLFSLSTIHLAYLALMEEHVAFFSRRKKSGVAEH